MVHCLALPVLLPLLSLSLHGENTSDMTHIIFAAILLPATLYAAYSGYRKHHQWMPVALFVVGVTAILSAVFFIHDLYGEFAEQLLTVAGSILLIIGHIRNYRLQHVCDSQCFTAHHTDHASQSHMHTHRHAHTHHTHTHHTHTHRHVQGMQSQECCTTHALEPSRREHHVAMKTMPLEA